MKPIYGDLMVLLMFGLMATLLATAGVNQINAGEIGLAIALMGCSAAVAISAIVTFLKSIKPFGTKA